MSSRAMIAVMAGVAVTVGVVAFQAGQVSGDEQAKARLYELRIYTTHDGRLPALHSRFKDHTMKLFEKHGMKNGLYWVPADEPNKLIYFVSHDSKEAADASWKGFINDPDWKKVAAESERDGKIVAKVDKWYMTLTDYSPADK
jgi:hypothetical protein